MNWRFTGLSVLHWQHFDGEWVIYDQGTGQTLAADALVAATLMALESGLSRLADIEGQVSSDLGLQDRAGVSLSVADSLAFLAGLGLVESEPS